MSIDAALGRLGNKSGVCTSSTRPINPFHGQVIFETDTNRTLVYDNAAWLVVADNQVLSIDFANGRVGIGTTSPSYKLDAQGQVQVGAGENITPDASGNGHLMIDGAGYSGFASLDGTAMWVGHNSGSRNLYLATNETARLIIDASGRVTMPNQPSFLVARSASFNSGQVVPYDIEYHDTTNSFSASTFVAPVSGMYFFYWTNIGLTSSGTVHRYYLRKNSANLSPEHQLRLDQTTFGAGYIQGTQTSVIPLAAGDSVQVYYTSDAGTASYANIGYTRFGGYLLG